MSKLVGTYEDRKGLVLLCILTAATLLSGGCVSDAGGKRKEPERTQKDKARPRIMVDGEIDFHQAPFRELLSTPPRDGQPVFFAAVPRWADREEEYERGIDALALQGARWKRAEVSAKYLTRKNNTEMGYLEEVEVETDAKTAEQLRDKIEVLVCYTDRGGSYLKGVVEGERQERLPLQSGDKGGEPEWIQQPPVYDGYLTAIGVANRHMYFSDSLRAADEQALANLARQISVQVEKKRLDLEQKGGTAFTQYTIQISETAVMGAYIIDRWVSPDGNSYYSFAVMPVKQ